jgi:hypothetical protein
MSHDGRVDVLPDERNLARVFEDLAPWPHLSIATWRTGFGRVFCERELSIETFVRPARGTDG